MGCCVIGNKDKELVKLKTLKPRVSFRENFGDLILKNDIHKFYTLTETLGHGEFGTVKKGYKQNDPSAVFAVKSVPKSKVASKLMLLERELTVLTRVDHPNIIKLFEIYDDKEFVHLVMEYCDGGELFEQIAKFGKFCEAEAAKIMYSLLHAVSHLHSQSISHRDLKPENIMFSSTDEHAEIKLVDFGLAKLFSNTEESLNTVVGTPYYVAPEVLNERYGISCDMWSLGVILYMLLIGKPPFPGNSPKLIIDRVVTGMFDRENLEWGELSDTAKGLIERMLCTSSKDRLPANEALEHPWLDNRVSIVSKAINKTILRRIRNTGEMNKLKRETMNVLIRYLSGDEISQLNSIFRALDKDHTGYINQWELKEGLIHAGVHVEQEELSRIMVHADQNGRGTIDYSEFLAATLDRKYFEDRRVMWLAFKTFDLDGSDTITRSNLLKALNRAGWNMEESEVDQLMDDLSCDREDLNFETFCALFNGEACSSLSSPVDNRA